MSARIIEIGQLLDANTKEFIPIFSLDSVDLGRGQDWSTQTVGPQSMQMASWKGSRPVTYNINFRLLVGWGAISTPEVLQDKISLYHSWASHDSAGAEVKSPRPVRLIIAGQVNMIGVLEEINTKLEGPWVIDEPNYGMRGMSCVFTGKMFFLPGMQKDGKIVVSTNNVDLGRATVRKSLYYIAS